MTNTRPIQEHTELQSFEPRGTKIQNTVKSHFRYIFRFHKSYGEQRQDPG